MGFIIEEDIHQSSTVYDAFYDRYFGEWSEKFEKYKDEMKNVSEIIGRTEKETKYLPFKKNLFDCFANTRLGEVKVVIWTDNPLSLNRSYANVYKELKTQYSNIDIPRDNNLLKFTDQGVLFISSSMCHSSDNPTIYSNLWFRFANIVIEILNENVDNCIHLLWGKNCQKIAGNISSREVYVSTDPSSYAFFGNNHFIKTNITLKRQGKKEIDWNVLS